MVDLKIVKLDEDSHARWVVNTGENAWLYFDTFEVSDCGTDVAFYIVKMLVGTIYCEHAREFKKQWEAMNK